MRLFLVQKGNLLVGNPQQQPFIQEAYHHKSLARSQGQLGLHDQRAARQSPRTRHKIELAEAPDQPDGQPEHPQQQKQHADGLGIAAPAEGALPQGRGLTGRLACCGLTGALSGGHARGLPAGVRQGYEA